MKLLGIDFGSKRIGLALTDDAMRMAFPHSVVPSDDTFLPAVLKLIEKEEVSEVVIGLSKDYKGNDNPIMREIDLFIRELNDATPIPVHLEPEVLSTQEAVRFQGRTEHTDAAAASIILNSFLDRRKNERQD